MESPRDAPRSSFLKFTSFHLLRRGGSLERRAKGRSELPSFPATRAGFLCNFFFLPKKEKRSKKEEEKVDLSSLSLLLLGKKKRKDALIFFAPPEPVLRSTRCCSQNNNTMADSSHPPPAPRRPPRRGLRRRGPGPLLRLLVQGDAGVRRDRPAHALLRGPRAQGAPPGPQGGGMVDVEEPLPPRSVSYRN